MICLRDLLRGYGLALPDEIMRVGRPKPPLRTKQLLGLDLRILRFERSPSSTRSQFSSLGMISRYGNSWFIRSRCGDKK